MIMETLELKDGYSQDRGLSGKYRRITLAEAKNLRYGQRVCIIDRHGRVRECKINGQPKTWKRDSSRIEIPCKYGLYEHFTLTKNDYTDIVIPLDK